MGMYSMVFGQNPMATVLLATLGFRSVPEVGRFRDAFISDGMIAVYTRNGGGNRECSHKDNPEWGDQLCRHHVEMIKGEERFVCEHPDSEECGCYGCVISYRLPKHPLYVRDEDDKFDSTYATIWFRFPPEHAETLKKFDTGEHFDPDKRWAQAIEALGGKANPNYACKGNAAEESK